MSTSPHSPYRATPISAAQIVIKPRRTAREPASDNDRALAGTLTEGFLARLRRLLDACGPDTSKHDLATVLITACIGEGIQAGPRIVDVATRFGFHARHVGMTLTKQAGPDAARHRWWKDANGKYVLHVGEPDH